MLIYIDETTMRSLSETEYNIIRFINANENKIAHMSIVEIANETFSSPASVSRAIRKCGVNGFHELRYKLVEKTTNKSMQDMNEVLHKSLVEAQRVIEQISMEQLLGIAKSLKKSKKIHVCARGLSEYVGQEFALKLQLMDYPAMFIGDPNIMKEKSKRLKADESLFIFSLNGYTPELIECVKNARLMNAEVIVCCCHEESPLLTYATYSLIGYKHEHDAISHFEVASRVSLSMMARIIIDYLAMNTDL